MTRAICSASLGYFILKTVTFHQMLRPWQHGPFWYFAMKHEIAVTQKRIVQPAPNWPQSEYRWPLERHLEMPDLYLNCFSSSKVVIQNLIKSWTVWILWVVHMCVVKWVHNAHNDLLDYDLLINLFRDQKFAFVQIFCYVSVCHARQN